MSSSPSIEAQHEDDYINEAVEVIRSDSSSADSRQYEGAAANAHVDKPAIEEDAAVYEQDFTLNAVDNTAVGDNIPPPPSSSSWLTPKKVMGLATLFVVIFAITTGIGAAKIAAMQSPPEAQNTVMVQSSKNNFWGATKSGKSNSGKVVTCIIQPIQTIFSIKPAITCDATTTLVPPTEKQFEKLYKEYMKECKDFWSQLLYRILIAAIEFWRNDKCEGGNDCSASSLPEACQFNLVKATMITVNETTARDALVACVEALGGGDDADDTTDEIV